MNINKNITFLFHKIIFGMFFPFLHFLYRLLPAKKNNKILVISLNYLGDVFMATPAINALKKLHPELKIDILIKKENIQVIKNNPLIHDIYFDCSDYSKKSNTLISFIKMILANFSVFFTLLRNDYDVVFDFTGSFESAFICGLSGKKKRYGLSWRPHFRNAFNDVIDGYSKVKHLRNINCDVVLKAGFKIDSKDCIYSLHISENIDNWAKDTISSFKSKYTIIVAPFAGWKQKEWDISNFLSLSLKLLSMDVTLIFTGSKSEAERLRPFDDFFNDRILNYCGKTSLFQSVALIKYSDLFIGLDSSQSHFSDALNTKSIIIFGPTNPLYHQIENNPRVKIIYKKFDCSPNGNRKYCHENCFTFECPENHRCMKTIGVDEVYNAAVHSLRTDKI